MKKQDLDLHKTAYDQQFRFHNENIAMLSCYSERMIQIIKDKGYSSCLSLGIGYEVVSKKIISLVNQKIEKYIIVEGSQKIIKEFMKNTPIPSTVSVNQSLFEEFTIEDKIDAIEMGFILEHVEDPLGIVMRYSQFLKPNGSMFIAVPNARSLHRLIGNKAGMLENLYQLSEHDLELGHKRYFDTTSLKNLIIEAGLRIINIEGIFLKPFASSQLESLHLSHSVMNALYSLGSAYPEIANAIYVETSL